MHDMGMMRKQPDIAVQPVDQTKEKYYPTTTLNEDQMPGLKGKKLGDTVDMMVSFKVKGVREAGSWSDSKTPEYDLSMMKCKECDLNA